MPCPTCTHSLTDAEFNTVKKEIIQELNNLKAKGVKLKSQLDDIVKLDTKAKEQFLQYQADDLKKLKKKLKRLSHQLPLILINCEIFLPTAISVKNKLINLKQ